MRAHFQSWLEGFEGICSVDFFPSLNARSATESERGEDERRVEKV